jgi:hypothetical protein
MLVDKGRHTATGSSSSSSSSNAAASAAAATEEDIPEMSLNDVLESVVRGRRKDKEFIV